jgi:2-desacetyl-2-hydroxyethyl bacteriochlorophyllide A dehydrogenase
MKAMVNARYGSPDVMELKEVEKPAPQDNEILVKVRATSVNAADWHSLRGSPLIFRFQFGFPKPKITILGGDVAGEVEAVGAAVTQFKPGDAVFGDASVGGFGAFAEYVTVPEHLLVPKPATITFEQAAAVPLAATTALQGLRRAGEIRPGDKVLINGATGGVGTFAVQIAKSYGAEVTGVCNPKKMDTVRSIGADHVIDYTQEDFTRNGQQYDVIIDIAANHSALAYRRALSPQGRYIFVGFSTMAHMIGIIILGAWLSRTTSKDFIFMGMAEPNQQDLLFVSDLLETGKIVPYIDKTYPLSGVPDAIRHMEDRLVHGKIVITVDH